MKLIAAQNSEFVKKLVEELGIVDYWRRIIIDISYNSVVAIYTETVADEDKLKLIPIDIVGTRVIGNRN